MNIKLQLVDHRSRAFPPGLEFTLLSAGQEVAKGTSDANGIISFDVASDAPGGYSVRFDSWPGLQEAINRFVIPKRP